MVQKQKFTSQSPLSDLLYSALQQSGPAKGQMFGFLLRFNIANYFLLLVFLHSLKSEKFLFPFAFSPFFHLNIFDKILIPGEGFTQYRFPEFCVGAYAKNLRHEGDEDTPWCVIQKTPPSIL